MNSMNTVSNTRHCEKHEGRERDGGRSMKYSSFHRIQRAMNGWMY